MIISTSVIFTKPNSPSCSNYECMLMARRQVALIISILMARCQVADLSEEEQLAMALSLSQDLAGQASRETAERQPRDSRETAERQPRDSRETAERQARDSRGTTERQPRGSRETAERQPRGSRGAAEGQPSDSRETVERQPRGSREAAERRPRDSRDISAGPHALRADCRRRGVAHNHAAGPQMAEKQRCATQC